MSFSSFFLPSCQVMHAFLSNPPKFLAELKFFIGLLPPPYMKPPSEDRENLMESLHSPRILRFLLRTPALLVLFRVTEKDRSHHVDRCIRKVFGSIPPRSRFSFPPGLPASSHLAGPADRTSNFRPSSLAVGCLISFYHFPPSFLLFFRKGPAVQGFVNPTVLLSMNFASSAVYLLHIFAPATFRRDFLFVRCADSKGILGTKPPEHLFFCFLRLVSSRPLSFTFISELPDNWIRFPIPHTMFESAARSHPFLVSAFPPFYLIPLLTCNSTPLVSLYVDRFPFLGFLRHC